MTVTILGAGIMGRTIALSFALANIDVNLYDVTNESLELAQKKILEHLEIQKEYNLVDDETKIMSHIDFVDNLEEAVKESEFIIEAVPEVLKIKEALYSKLSDLLTEDIIVASNTSTFSLEKLQKLYHYKDKICITHYFNPAHLVPLVEVVTNSMTEQDISFVKTLLEKSGKEVILLNQDIDGFVVNRLQAALLREAFNLVENNIASFEDIDKAVKFGPGLRWALNGPFEIADFGGLDTWDKVVSNLFPDLSNRQDTPEKLIEKNKLNELGTKTGKGFYDYSKVDLVNAEKDREKQMIEILITKNK
ncbi:3-hydroxybutyryl-CoA dehydrogenase [Macrococcus epidermidis]|uniref:6-phosphogluconate dehydrogenase, decarboxylating n=1 Tax=Macrococcus epidermidis TaxID=1902580 RepID=A0A327ZY07_9STAP|nr:3-hydroxyacyl-CoA dehydrogenase family protein [Macrococcus epidermidis]RAK45908.1 3-hydroxybutyryl-CoA dehydrogenase [Macrococcus epidermidis]